MHFFSEIPNKIFFWQDAFVDYVYTSGVKTSSKKAVTSSACSQLSLKFGSEPYFL